MQQSARGWQWVAPATGRLVIRCRTQRRLQMRVYRTGDMRIRILLLPGLGLLSALAFGAMMAASRLLPLGLFGILSYVEPVLLFGVAVLFLGETFAPQQLWTYLPIWLAVLLIGWDSARLLRKQTQQLG